MRLIVYIDTAHFIFLASCNINYESYESVGNSISSRTCCILIFAVAFCLLESLLKLAATCGANKASSSNSFSLGGGGY